MLSSSPLISSLEGLIWLVSGKVHPNTGNFKQNLVGFCLIQVVTNIFDLGMISSIKTTMWIHLMGDIDNWGCFHLCSPRSKQAEQHAAAAIGNGLKCERVLWMIIWFQASIFEGFGFLVPSSATQKSIPSHCTGPFKQVPRLDYLYLASLYTRVVALSTHTQGVAQSWYSQQSKPTKYRSFLLDKSRYLRENPTHCGPSASFQIPPEYLPPDKQRR